MFYRLKILCVGTLLASCGGNHEFYDDTLILSENFILKNDQNNLMNCGEDCSIELTYFSRESGSLKLHITYRGNNKFIEKARNGNFEKGLTDYFCVKADL